VDDAGGVVALLCIVRLECVGHLAVWLFVTSKEGEKVVGIHGRGVHSTIFGERKGKKIAGFSIGGDSVNTQVVGQLTFGKRMKLLMPYSKDSPT
jgi:hypothetical protein